MAKTGQEPWLNRLCESLLGNIFKVEMFIRSIPTPLLKILCKFNSNSKFILKSIIGPDDNL